MDTPFTAQTPPTSDSPYLQIRSDPYAGRKYHASAALLENTDLFGRCAPYSYTIWKRFRNEVCAECWRYDGGRRAFLTRRDDEKLGADGPPRRSQCSAAGAGAGVGAGLCFCDERCQRAWLDREGAGVVDLLRQLEAARQKKAKPKPKSDAGEREDEAEVEITQELVERKWDAVRDGQRSSKEVRKWRNIQLEDYEADMARYVLLALRRCLRERGQCMNGRSSPHPGLPGQTNGALDRQSEWSTFASLQQNELQLLRACPQILEHQTRIYQLLRGRFGAASGADGDSAGGLGALVTIENVRTVLGVDPGNAFGIWETPLMEESECLGFAVYPVASFFNHHCAPNVRKERDGRTLRFLTTRAVGAGQELCISYGHVEKMDFETRQKELLEGWYFECRCSRCTADADAPRTS
ncbi:hypothetical protein C8Q79DRAFT_918191 [Trametes meyenii]|nr:hypothetical protein C8Q79DRAFT_918191 [Trametes meyenii]